jgi:FkbM family methyltransferase
MGINMSQRERLLQLLSEPIDSVKDREYQALNRKISDVTKPFVLFGAGNLGRKALRKLVATGVRPVAFIDNDSSKWGSTVDNVPVTSPSKFAESNNPKEVGVITTIWCGEASDRMSDRVAPLQKLGYEKIAFFGDLAWRFPAEFLPHYSLDLPSKVISQRERVLAAFDLFSEQYSQELFVNHIEWRLTLNYDLLPLKSEKLIYFDESIYNLNEHETLFDIGAYTGDSVRDFLSTSRGKRFRAIHSFEPVATNFSDLDRFIRSIGGLDTGSIVAHRLALGDEIGEITVETGNGPASRVGRGDTRVPMTTVDIFSDKYGPPTLIKMDIEGFESKCLSGARRTITETRPLVAVCVYHLQSHIWDIPLQISECSVDYEFKLVPHLADGWDLVLYAIPAERKI